MADGADTGWGVSSAIDDLSALGQNMRKRASVYLGLQPQLPSSVSPNVHVHKVAARKPQARKRSAVTLQSFGSPAAAQKTMASQAKHGKAGQELIEMSSCTEAHELPNADSPYSANFGRQYSGAGSPQHNGGSSPQYGGARSPLYSGARSPQHNGDSSPQYSGARSPQHNGGGSLQYNGARSPQHNGGGSPFMPLPVQGLPKEPKTKAEAEAEARAEAEAKARVLIDEITSMASQKLRWMASCEAKGSELRATGGYDML